MTWQGYIRYGMSCSGLTGGGIYWGQWDSMMRRYREMCDE